MKPEIFEKPEQLVVEIKIKAMMIMFPFVMKKGFTNLVNFVKKSGIKITEPPYCRYINVTDDLMNSKLGIFKKWDIILGIPVSKKIESSAGFICTTYKAGRYAQTLHKGPYKNLGKTHQILQKWIKDNKHTYQRESAEVYISDPSTTNANDLETIVQAKI